MNNVMLDPLPDEWKGFFVNTDFRIGLQISLLQYDKEISEREKVWAIIWLMFESYDEKDSEENPVLREYPDGDDLQECIHWFLNGWYHDRPVQSDDRRKLVDYDIDQWRIYADFLQIYGIDLSVADMHWWKFNGLLWNMPQEQSSFLQAIEIRRKEISARMSREERKAVERAQAIYALEQPEERKQYTKAEQSKIDEYDRMMEEIRKRKQEEKELLDQFRK